MNKFEVGDYIYNKKTFKGKSVIAKIFEKDSDTYSICMSNGIATAMPKHILERDCVKIRNLNEFQNEIEAIRCVLKDTKYE
ncbi:hypothetical protein [uncultured Campylobacter sp.]|uniref:hypothetical protein n=1 Tax=uncultured Campylobacter sp. TaxID=218934 RepID=UPI00262531F8|nr:hypothetical protein [uncultured Campylobacter sp.]